jgi:hypothetical protein
MRTYILTFLVLLVVTVCLCSAVITGDPLAWIDHVSCLLQVGEFGACLLSGALVPSFKATRNRMPVSGVDYDPDKPMCQDDYEYYTGTGEYTDNPICVVCGAPASEYAALPNGDVISVCSDHVCEHGKIHFGTVSYEYNQINHVLETVRANLTSHPSLQPLARDILLLLDEWKHPCYTCRTSM